MRPFPAAGFDTETYVIEENGRFAVYLDVAMVNEDPADPAPFHVRRHRIRDYATAQEAEVASRWIRRGAARTLPHPPTGH